MNLHRDDDGRSSLRPWQQRTLAIAAAVVISAVVLITMLSGHSFF
ncbi:hypothetical protein [Rathayibacter toxicus]|nr:hypothetical protein [Rathayibacter toxicus]